MVRRQHPVSCLCVTKGAPKDVRNALDCFFAQTHEPKQLVVVDQFMSLEEVNALTADPRFTGPSMLCYVRCPADMKLGELRHVSLHKATWDLVAQWDDDDWHHPERLARQVAHYNASEEGYSSLLSKWMVLDKTTGRLYRSFRRNEGWEGSVLMARDCAIRVGYPSNLSKAEDRAFMGRFQRRYGSTLLDAPELYTYCYHGNNTWDREHWEFIFERCEEITGKEKQQHLETMQWRSQDSLRR